MRKLVPALAALATVAALSACSGAAATPDDSTPTPTATASKADCSKVSSGDTSDSVGVTGDFRAEPKVDIPTPLKADSLERSVIIPGKGEPVKSGAVIDIAVAAYNGTTGDELLSNGFGDEAAVPVTVDTAQFIPGLVCSLEGVPLGSRVVTTSTVKEAFGSKDAASVNLKATDSVVFVVDVVRVAPKVPSKANGVDQTPKPGFPSVTLADDGTPTVTIPGTEPPSTTQVEVLKLGDGATVAQGDTVTLQYQGVNWRTGKVFDQSWGKGPTQFPTTGVIPGFSKALVGQKVGSQVVVVIPPADGYGPQGGQPSAGIEKDDTLVFVIDILAVTP